MKNIVFHGPGPQNQPRHQKVNFPWHRITLQANALRVTFHAESKLLNHNIFVSLHRNNHHNHQNKYFRACTKGDLEEVKASLKEMKKEGLGKKKESKAVEAEKKALAKESGVPAGNSLFTF